MNQDLLRALIVASEQLKRAYDASIDANRRDVAREVRDAQFAVNDAMSLCLSAERKVS